MNIIHLFNIFLLLVLFIGNIYFNYNYYFIIIYLSLIIYHIYIFFCVLKTFRKKKINIIVFLFVSIIIYPFTYYLVCDPNPISCFLTYYIFFPNFLKAIIIILIHTYFLSKYIENKYIKNFEILPFENENNAKFSNQEKGNDSFYFLSDFINYITKNKRIFLTFLLFSFLFISLEIFIFLKRIKLWIYFNDKTKTLPKASSNNTTFYITAMVVNIEPIIVNFINQMKNLIIYLGKENVIVSIVENGDSTDKTQEYLKDFRNYLNENEIYINIFNFFYYSLR